MALAGSLKNVDGRWTPYRIHKPDAPLRLLCFSYAGAGASVFRPWVTDAPGDIDVWPIPLPSKGARFRETPYSRIEPLIDELCEVLASCLCGRYALFGASMGAIIAFELARAARRRGLRSPVRLFAAGRRPPHQRDAHPPMHQLPDDELIQRLAEFDGTQPEILASAELMNCFLPSLRADFALCERYVYRREPRLDCPITALAGAADPYATVREVSAWRSVTHASFALRVFDGGHFFVQSCAPDVLRAVVNDCGADLVRAENSLDEPNGRRTVSRLVDVGGGGSADGR